MEDDKEGEEIRWFRCLYPDKEERNHKALLLGGRPGIKSLYNNLIDRDFDAFTKSVTVHLVKQGQPIVSLLPEILENKQYLNAFSTDSPPVALTMSSLAL